MMEQAHTYRDENDVSLYRAIQAVTRSASKRSGLRKFVTNFERVRRAATDSTLRQTVEAALQAANVRRKATTAVASRKKPAADSDDEQDGKSAVCLALAQRSHCSFSLVMSQMRTKSVRLRMMWTCLRISRQKQRGTTALRLLKTMSYLG